MEDSRRKFYEAHEPATCNNSRHYLTKVFYDLGKKNYTQFKAENVVNSILGRTVLNYSNKRVNYAGF